MNLRNLYNELVDLCRRQRYTISMVVNFLKMLAVCKKDQNSNSQLKAGYGIIINVGRRSKDNTSVITISRKTTTDKT